MTHPLPIGVWRHCVTLGGHRGLSLGLLEDLVGCGELARLCKIISQWEHKLGEGARCVCPNPQHLIHPCMKKENTHQNKGPKLLNSNWHFKLCFQERASFFQHHWKISSSGKVMSQGTEVSKYSSILNIAAKLNCESVILQSWVLRSKH